MKYFPRFQAATAYSTNGPAEFNPQPHIHCTASLYHNSDPNHIYTAQPANITIQPPATYTLHSQPISQFPQLTTSVPALLTYAFPHTNFTNLRPALSQHISPLTPTLIIIFQSLLINNAPNFRVKYFFFMPPALCLSLQSPNGFRNVISKFVAVQGINYTEF